MNGVCLLARRTTLDSPRPTSPSVRNWPRVPHTTCVRTFTCLTLDEVGPKVKGTKIPIEPISRDSKDFPAVGMTLFADDYVRSRVLAHDVPDSGGVFISPQQYRLPDGPNFGSVAR